MKASKLIELLAKQIADQGDQETYFTTEMSAGYVGFDICSIECDGEGDFSIYGEMV